MYNDEVAITYKKGGHTYTVSDPANGVEGIMPSVTKILGVLNKPALVNWSARCAADYIRATLKPGVSLTVEEIEAFAKAAHMAHRTTKQAACDIGTAAHLWIASFIEARRDGNDFPPYPADEKTKHCCTAAEGWLNTVKMRPVAIEKIVYSRGYKYIGTLDAVGGVVEIAGQLAVVDWKSSVGIYPEYRLQLAAYKNAYEEETGTRGLKRILIKLGKNDGVFEVHLLEDDTYEADLEAFLGLIPAQRRMHEIEAEAKAGRA